MSEPPDSSAAHGVEVHHGITMSGDVVMSVLIRCGGDIHLASELAQRLDAIIHTVWDAATAPDPLMPPHKDYDGPAIDLNEEP